MLEAEGMDLTDFVELSGDVAALDAVLPFDLFVDDAGRVRRVNLTIDLETLESMGAAELPPGAKFSMTSTVDFFDFGSDHHFKYSDPESTMECTILIGSAHESEYADVMSARKSKYSDTESTHELFILIVNPDTKQNTLAPNPNANPNPKYPNCTAFMFFSIALPRSDTLNSFVNLSFTACDLSVSSLVRGHRNVCESDRDQIGWSGGV